MMRFLFPLIIIGLAAAIFFGFTDPLINNPLEPGSVTDQRVEGGILALQLEKAKLNEALKNAQQLRSKIDALTVESNNISAEKLARLDQFLPNHVDNVQLIIDINNIAKAHGMEIRDVKVQTQDPKTQTPVTSRAGSMEQGSVSLSFSVSGPYRVFQEFLIDLSRSIRIVDINSVSLATGDAKTGYTYTVNIRTYWLK